MALNSRFQPPRLSVAARRHAVLAALVSLAWTLPSSAQSDAAVYRVTFEGQWTARATPGGVPASAHFSPLIGAVHNADVTFWESGTTASAGIESMAEIGGTSALEDEIEAAGSNVSSVLKPGGNIGTTGTAMLDTVTLTAAHPQVTMVTMVAPSPDWFVGIPGLALRDAQGNWLRSRVVDLFPYDAGTEDGTEFSLNNNATSPHGVITSIKGTGKFSNEPIARLTFVLAVEPVIEAQTLRAGDVLVLDVSDSFDDQTRGRLRYLVESADPAVAEAEVDDEGVVTLRGVARGVTAVTVTTLDQRDGRVANAFAVTVGGPALVALVPRASDPVREGFVRVINHSAEAGEVTIEAVDDAGMSVGPVALALPANATVHFNSKDLEAGNAAKGFPDGVGAGQGDWRLVLDSDLDFEVLSYIRTVDGFLAAMHDTVPAADGLFHVATFNPGANVDQESRLRLVNPTAEAAGVVVTGVDDAGASSGTAVALEVPAGASVTLTASELESGTGVDGALGEGAGKWRLAVETETAVVAMILLSSPTGHLTNLSTVPRARAADGDGRHVVPLFPSASASSGRQGFVRVANRSAEAGTVTIEAYDGSDRTFQAVTLIIGGGATAHFNSDDLEVGKPAKGLTGSTGAGTGDWLLVLSSALDLEVLAYIRAADGFLTSMHDVAPVLGGVHRVAIFNPASNLDQASSLRLVNPGTEEAEVTVIGVDDSGASPGTAVVLTVPRRRSRTVAAAALESGGEDFEGALGDGEGKWRLRVSSESPVVVMNLLSSPAGHLSNLSTAPDRGGL